MHVILIYYNLPVSQTFQQQFQYCEGVNSPHKLASYPMQLLADPSISMVQL